MPRDRYRTGPGGSDGRSSEAADLGQFGVILKGSSKRMRRECRFGDFETIRPRSTSSQYCQWYERTWRQRH